MKIDDILKRLTDRYGDRLLKVERKSHKRAYIDIYPKEIVDVAGYIFRELGMRFNIASAVDELERLEILYHFSYDPSGIIISVRTLLNDKDNPRIDTITGVTPAAWWIEREIHELFGIHFDGNEDLRQLLLPDDWPKGVYPLRKSFVVPKRDSRKS
ncbi:MAG: NADH-quinone oxidoreductase subunit C [Candidatus Omnitrophica bacterium]|nr:NADH-quinone oxidoreductase subunit C [Candidatus Omnitrophota bacterium]